VTGERDLVDEVAGQALAREEHLRAAGGEVEHDAVDLGEDERDGRGVPALAVALERLEREPPAREADALPVGMARVQALQPRRGPPQAGRVVRVPSVDEQLVGLVGPVGEDELRGAAILVEGREAEEDPSALGERRGEAVDVAEQLADLRGDLLRAAQVVGLRAERAKQPRRGRRGEQAQAASLSADFLPRVEAIGVRARMAHERDGRGAGGRKRVARVRASGR